MINRITGLNKSEKQVEESALGVDLIDWSVTVPGLAPCNYLSLAVMLHGSDAEVIMRAHTSLVIPFLFAQT